LVWLFYEMGREDKKIVSCFYLLKIKSSVSL